MKNKIIVVLLLIITALTLKSLRLKQIYAINQAVLLDSIKSYKVLDSLSAVTINALTLSKAELEKYRAEDMALIKKLKNTKPLTQYATADLKTDYIIKTVVKDSIIHDTCLVASTINYQSEWLSIKGVIYKDSANLQIINKERLLIVQSKVPKRFCGIKLPIRLFGKKTEKIDIVSQNPHTIITGTEFIVIK